MIARENFSNNEYFSRITSRCLNVEEHRKQRLSFSQFVRVRIPRVPFPMRCVRIGEFPNPPVTRMRFLYSSEALQPRLGYEMQNTYCANAVIAFPSSIRAESSALSRNTLARRDERRGCSIYGVVKMSWIMQGTQ